MKQLIFQRRRELGPIDFFFFFFFSSLQRLLSRLISISCQLLFSVPFPLQIPLTIPCDGDGSNDGVAVPTRLLFQPSSFRLLNERPVFHPGKIRPDITKDQKWKAGLDRLAELCSAAVTRLTLYHCFPVYRPTPSAPLSTRSSGRVACKTFPLPFHSTLVII